MRVILASTSPRRKELLSNIIENYEIIPSNFNEDIIKKSEKTPEELVKTLAFSKANDVFSSVIEEKEIVAVIGADTIVYFNNTIIGKPKNKSDAFRMLNELQGKSHDVYTGMSVIMKKHDIIKQKTICSKSSVQMKKMSEDDIWEYIKTREPLDKAGAYAIQGIGRKYISSFIGNFNTIVGLDTIELEKVFKEFNIF